MRPKALSCLIALIWVAAAAAVEPGVEFSRDRVLVEGRSDLYNMTSHVEMELVMRNAPRGMNIPKSMRMTLDMEYDIEQLVESVTEEGAAVRMTCERIVTAMRVPGMAEVTYDSADPRDKGKGDMPQFKAFSSLVGRPIMVRLDPDGQLVEVTGVSDVIDRAVRGVPLDRREQIISQIEQFANGLGNFVADSGGFLPEELIKPGDSWMRTSTTEAMMVGEIVNELEYTYAGRAEWDGLPAHRFEIRVVNNAIQALAQGLVPGGVEILRSSSPPTTGEVFLDPESGLVLRHRLSTNAYFELGFVQAPDPSMRNVTMDVILNTRKEQTLIR